MSIKINNFGGKLVWYFRVNHPGFSSKLALQTADFLYRRNNLNYIKKFMAKKEIPLFQQVMIETVNRCNGKCSFCPANVGSEVRPFKKMDEALFYKIIEQLKDLNYAGAIYLNVNNEPFIDTRILTFAGCIKKEIPKAKVNIITNGTLLTKEKMVAAAECIDNMVINDYGGGYELSDAIKEVYEHVCANAEKFAKINILINRRYGDEVLATRAGAAPNKPKKTFSINSPCIYPFTDLVIFPDGKVGICCNDCFEVGGFGDVNIENLYDIWKNDKFRDLRKKMCMGRESYPFCKECDVVDAGSREKLSL
ncbi:MAG: SPASM domain-containing protein [Butyrivibrio sp.]|nr:SPASM domain-containing protein [Butyrivibrio sp.]